MVFLGETKVTIAVFVRDSIIFIALYAAGLTWLPTPLFLEILNGILCGVCLMTVALYLPSLPELWQRGANNLALIRLGISIGWADQLLQSMARVYFIEFRADVGGRTFDASYGSPAIGYIIAATLHIIAIGMDGNRFPRRNVHLITGSILGGMGAVLVLRGIHLIW